MPASNGPVTGCSPQQQVIIDMQSISRLSLILLLSSSLCAQQLPDKFSNLQVLPRDISKNDLMQLMRSFAFALNVRCNYCHLEKAAPDAGFDFAADDKPPKKIARVMLTMTANINRDYLSKLGKPEPVKVECATCHRGLTEPRPLKAVLADTLEKQGINATIAQYRDLRSKYYGSGQYDFGETQLNQFTESLMQAGKHKEAVAVAELNFQENHPDSIWSYHLLAMAHEGNGETAKAIDDYRNVVRLHPEDTWAKGRLESLTIAK